MQVVSAETYNIQPTYNLNDYTTTTTTTEAIPVKDEELPIAIPHVNQPVYPGFTKYFYIALFIVLTTVSIVAIDIVRNLRKDRKAKKEGKRTYQKIAPRI